METGRIVGYRSFQEQLMHFVERLGNCKARCKEESRLTLTAITAK